MRAMLAGLIGEPVRRASLGLEAPYELSDEEIDQRVSECVSLFSPILKGNFNAGQSLALVTS